MSCRLKSPDLEITLTCLRQGKNVLRKEPMSRDVGEQDVFIFNAGFHSKFYKVKIGTVSAQKESEPEKQETRQKARARMHSPPLQPAFPGSLRRKHLDVQARASSTDHPVRGQTCSGVHLILQSLSGLASEAAAVPVLLLLASCASIDFDWCLCALLCIPAIMLVP